MTRPQRRRKQPAMGDMRQRVKICAWIEQPDADIAIIRERPPIAEVWAQIKPARPVSEWGFHADFGDDERPTHEITIRTPRDFLITSQMWVFHVSGFFERWYRVLKTKPADWDTAQFTTLYCAEREFRDRRADPVAVQQVPGADFEAPAMDKPLASEPNSRLFR